MTILPPNTDPAMAVDFFDAWFGGEYPERFCVVTQMSPASKRMRTIHTHVDPVDARDMFAEYGMDTLVYFKDIQWNLYMSVGVTAEKPARGRKGGKRDIVAVPGVWIDLDTDKVGFFDDETECLEFLRGLPEDAWPSIVVATGTGGVHGYWKTERPLEMEECEELCLRWWAYLSTRTDKRIDKLCNADRIMKLPGSVRWPKETYDAPALVRLLYADGSRRTSIETLKTLTEDAWTARQSDIRERQQRVSRGRVEAQRDLIEMTGRWNMLMALADIEDEFNRLYTWDDILLPKGWSKIDQDAEGRDVWARPGLSEYEIHKSAATDYEGSHVMSLFSDSLETGLSHLIDTGIVLTKYRVFIETWWDGDEAGFVRSYVQNGQAPTE